MTTRTRFAPSPTGFLHIGGARTALFNWLYARRKGGQFLLRIEDTDKKRSTQAAIDAILDGLNWLGLTPDEPPVFQSKMEARHREVVEEMLASGAAFKCYVTTEELAARREKAEELLKVARDETQFEADRAAARIEADALLAAFRSPYRDGKEAPSHDAPYVVRLRSVDSGRIEQEDGVQGLVGVEARELDDMILLRADGSPTYMLAVVVDDHDMGITDIIRGDDHLINSFRQIQIYNAMGWKIPAFSHVSLIHGPDGAKLSKRHGAQGIEEYRDMGYLPEGIDSYLLRLGWSDGSDEILSKEDAIKVFNISGLKKSPARIDFDKMAFTNAHFLKEADNDRVLNLIVPLLEEDGSLSGEQRTRIESAIGVLKGRGNTLHEVANSCAFLLTSRPLEISGKARKKLNGDALQILENLSIKLASLSPWTAENIEACIGEYCETNELSMGKVGPPLRVALTGGLPAPDLGLVLQWFGKEETLDRVRDVTASVA